MTHEGTHVSLLSHTTRRGQGLRHEAHKALVSLQKGVEGALLGANTLKRTAGGTANSVNPETWSKMVCAASHIKPAMALLPSP